MNNPFLARAHPRHYLYTAIGDFALALPVAGVWLGLIELEHENWALIPAWAWPAVTGLLVVSGFYSLWRHFNLRRR